MSIQSVYEQYKHMSPILEDLSDASDFKTTILHDCWLAISVEARQPHVDIDAAVLLDTAVLLEEADKSDTETGIAYRRRAAAFRSAAQRREEAKPSVQACCSCDRLFLTGTLNGICDVCYEDKIA